MTTFGVMVPAKVNLHLQVLGRREDGFHELRTFFQSFDLFDEVAASPAPAGVTELQVEPDGAAPAGEENLVLKAAAALRRRAGVTLGASLRLKKDIPVGAGLGGGSADAAATLVLLDEMWGLGLERSEMREIASGLGSDVPFFLQGGTAMGCGRGDEITPLPDQEPRGILVVMVPGQASTAEVFREFDIRLTSARPEATVDAFAAEWPPFGAVNLSWDHLYNDLEGVVIGKWPEVGEALGSLQSLGPLHAALTGSGTATFAIFPDVEGARLAAERLRDRWQIHVGSTLQQELALPVVKRRSSIRKESRK